MGDVVLFVPAATKAAKENLADFIKLAREQLTAFGVGGSWEEDRWEQLPTVAVFSTKTAPSTSYSFVPFAEPFLQFAKAYLRYKFSHRPVKSVAMMLQALRCVEAGLIESTGRADIELLNGAVMDVCATKCRQFFTSEDVLHKTGLQMQALFEFLREKILVPSLPAWKSPFKKPKILSEDLGEAGRDHRESRLPSNGDMLALADAFALANDVDSQFYSSISILLMVAPGRVSEVLTSPVNLIGWEPDDSGDQQMHLRWRAAKGKGATKKWVVVPMRDAVQEALRRLQKIGEPARLVAKSAFEALRLNPADEQASRLVKEFGGAFWPFIDDKRTVKVWEALCLHRVYEFNHARAVQKESWRLPTPNEVNRRLGDRAGQSLFDRLGLKGADGGRIQITSHQPRHWLSTMGERAGMDDYTLARWAGRAKVSDNRHYDHRTPEERLAEARGLLSLEQPTLLERFKMRQPVTYQELGVERLGAGLATLYGLCVHDYAMAPCQKQRECMTCKEHVCIKGDHVTLERILLLEAQTEVLLAQAQSAHEDGAFGADRWVDSHKWKLAHCKAMRMALEHPSVPDGAVLRIPDEHDPSPVRRALLDLGVVEIPSVEALSPKIIPLALT